MTAFRADLHCHSTCSDGTMSPKELVDLAVEQGLQGLCITDHDTTDAYPAVLEYARSVGIEMIAGAEFSTRHNDVSIHLLGYSFDLGNEALRTFCRRHAERRRERNLAILNKLRQLGYSIGEEELMQLDPEELPKGRRSIGRPHIAMAMMRHGYVSSVAEAFKRFLAENKPAYVPGTNFGVAETIKTVRDAGGVIVIAHPHLIKRRKTVKQLLSFDFDGVEAYYARFHRDEEEKWLQIANEKNWIFTGGSDFHGTAKPHIQLGCSWVPHEVFRPLRERFIGNNPNLNV